MADTYNVYEAKTHLSALMERAGAGEEIVLAKAGKKLCRMVPMGKSKRVFGRLKGKLKIAPDAFSSELDEKIWADSDEGSVFPVVNKPRRKRR